MKALSPSAATVTCPQAPSARAPCPAGPRAFVVHPLSSSGAWPPWSPTRGPNLARWRPPRPCAMTLRRADSRRPPRARGGQRPLRLGPTPGPHVQAPRPGTAPELGSPHAAGLHGGPAALASVRLSRPPHRYGRRSAPGAASPPPPRPTCRAPALAPVRTQPQPRFPLARGPHRAPRGLTTLDQRRFAVEQLKSDGDERAGLLSAVHEGSHQVPSRMKTSEPRISGALTTASGGDRAQPAT